MEQNVETMTQGTKVKLGNGKEHGNYDNGESNGSQLENQVKIGL